MSTHMFLRRGRRGNAICLRAEWDPILIHPGDYLEGDGLRTSIFGYTRISNIHTISAVVALTSRFSIDATSKEYRQQRLVQALHCTINSEARNVRARDIRNLGLADRAYQE